MEPQRFEEVENVMTFVRSMPDFPGRARVLDRLEQRNVNRYQEAMLLLNEVLAQPESDSTTGSASHEEIRELVNRLARLEASDPVGG